MKTPFVVLALVLGTAPAAHAACFTIYDEKNVVVYQSTEPPIDLSQRIGTQMARRFPRHFLVMADSSDGCAAMGSFAAGGRQGAARNGDAALDSPLFRNAASSVSSLPSAGGGYSGAPSGGDGRPAGIDAYADSVAPAGGTLSRGDARPAPDRSRR